MVAHAAYFDDSSNDGIYVVAGYVASVQCWEVGLVADWWQIMRTAYASVPEFKASDCRHGVQTFEGWPVEARNALTERLVSLLVSDVYRDHIMGVAAAVSVGDAVSKIPSRLDRSKLESFFYYFLFTQVVRDVLQLTHAVGEKLGEESRVDFIFDRQPDRQGHALSTFRQLQDALAERYRGLVSTLTFADSAEATPLQAADLLAYETYKEVRNRQELPERRVSTALRRLVEGRPHLAHFYDREKWIAIARNEDSPELTVYNSLAKEQITRGLREILKPGGPTA